MTSREGRVTELADHQGMQSRLAFGVACIAVVASACGGGAATGATGSVSIPPSTTVVAPASAPVATPSPTASMTTTTTLPTTTTAVPGLDWRDTGTIPFAGDVVRLAAAPFGLVGVVVGGSRDAPELGLATKLAGRDWQVTVRPTVPADRTRRPALAVRGDAVWVWSEVGTFRSTDGTNWEELPPVTCLDGPLPARNQPSYAYRCETLSMALTVGDAFVGMSPGQWAREYDTGDRTDAYWTSSDGLTWQNAPILPEDAQRPTELRSHQTEVASLALVDGAVVALRALDPILLVRGSDAWTSAPLPTPDGYVPSPNDGILFRGVAIANAAAGPIVAATLDDSVGFAKTGFVWIRDESGNWQTATSAHVWDVLDAAAGPAGYVVLVETTEHRLEIWTSTDGVRWITTSIGLSTGYAATVIATADGFAIGSGPSVYVSP